LCIFEMTWVLGLFFLGFCIVVIKFVFFCAGVGRQPHGPLASPARSRGKRPSSSDSQEETSQKARRDRRPNWSLNEMIALVMPNMRNSYRSLTLSMDVTSWNPRSLNGAASQIKLWLLFLYAFP